MDAPELRGRQVRVTASLIAVIGRYRCGRTDLQQEIYFAKGLEFVRRLPDFRVKRRRKPNALSGLGTPLASKLNKD
ncbi:hypothetical protein AWT69_004195 [Pseudomonas putida]|nr:hypothetical protein AWT69_004195 [Pseudomonas putida]